MISHTMYALRPLALGLLFIGLAMGVAGVITGSDSPMRAGMLTSLAALPAAVLGMMQRAHILADDQLADAHRAGYELALDHVARGLLDQPADHTPPHGARY
ncbi:hypothetical protein OG946_20355 [Streptomyces sp. NBC_01808]|uniref:hypothetical protein n=1 Tax=Streptomyces sp. NBC_01808 TaxID=2975947 RepID=UPI002DD83696|nr:hypothetical protein [Streptomyces sp. NBC_01808]WSA39509.1 hypothetical protein OG946_20355 [Streptomyces sp. NBC_01808]